MNKPSLIKSLILLIFVLPVWLVGFFILLPGHSLHIAIIPGLAKK